MTDRDLTVIRAATADDVPAIASTLVAAFDEDPVINWIVTRDDRWAERVNAFMTVIVRDICLPQGMTYVTEDLAGVA